MLRKSLAFIVVTLLLASGVSAQSVGLVLSGGGAKGLYHIGVIQALEENGSYLTTLIVKDEGEVV